MNRWVRRALVAGLLLSGSLGVLAAGLAVWGWPESWAVPGGLGASGGELPVLHEVPAFELTSHRGEAVTREDMLGRVWVADFFLTRCTGVCPVLASQMGLVQERLAEAGLLGDEVGLMSFNVDGDHDDVERVADWAAGHEVGADWHVVTGPRAEVWPMVREGFMMYVGQSQGDETTPVAHSSQLVVIDRAGRVRAHVSGLLPDTPEQVMAVVEALVEEG